MKKITLVVCAFFFVLILNCDSDSNGDGDGLAAEAGGCLSGSVSFSGYDCLPDALDLPGVIEVEREELGYTENIAIEDYVKGVLYHEMGPSFPAEALKAQAVAIRSYAVSWMTTRNEPICDSTMCQVYGDERDDATDAAVDDTAGVVVVFDGQFAQTVYHASSGGFTENVKDVWGSDYATYLQSVPCLENAVCTADCDACPEEGDGVCDASEPGCCWGRNGHGVGMSQRGAQAMAQCGFDHHEILTHYYSGVSVATSCE